MNDTRRIVPAVLNGGPAALIYAGPKDLIGAVFVEPGEHGKIARIRWVRNPAKLTRLPPSVHEAW
jgi:hypothetical protein